MVGRQGCSGMPLKGKQNVAIFSTYFPLDGSILERVGEATPKAQVPIVV